MNIASRFFAAVLSAVVLGAGAAACGNSGQAPQPQQPQRQEAPVMVRQPPVAGDVARQLGAEKFIPGEIGDAKVLWGMTSGGTCWIKGVKYGVNTFTTKTARDRWLKVSRDFGVNPKWMTETAVVYPSLVPGK